MATNAIEYTADEVALIKTVGERELDWGCDELNTLRGRIKQFYLKDQGLRCCYCRRRNATTHGRAWDIEHVIAQASHPTFMFEPENLAVACIDCNSAKRDQVVLVKPRKTFPRESAAYSIVHPHYDRWEEHFMFGTVVYAAKTAKGARTIELCRLWRFYELEGQDALFSQDRRYADLAEQVLFARTAHEAEPSVLAINALIKQAVEAEVRAEDTGQA